MSCHFIPIVQWNKYKVGKYTIIVAQTGCQNQQGLQHVSQIPENFIVLFRKISGLQFFHTQNCRFPLDILSLDKAGMILSIWTVDPEQKLVGPTPVGTQSVLESHAGWASKNLVKVGDNLSFLLKE